MTSRRIALLAGLVMLSGCGLLPINHPMDWHYSDHTVQDLCDFPKQLFYDRFSVTEVRVNSIVSKTMTEKIGVGSGCDYYKTAAEGGNVLGYVYLWQESEKSSSPPADYVQARTVTIDGVPVTEFVEPASSYQDTATSGRSYKLTASIDGWVGKLGFTGGDDEGTQAGARVLVDMIRALKG